MSSPVRPERPRPDPQPRRAARAPGGRPLDPLPDLGPAEPGFRRDATATRADTALQPSPTRSVGAGGPRGSPRRSQQPRLLDVLGAAVGVRADDSPLSMAGPPGFIGGKRLAKVPLKTLVARRNAERADLRTRDPQRMRQLEESIEFRRLNAPPGGTRHPKGRRTREVGEGPFQEANEFLELEEELERRIFDQARVSQRHALDQRIARDVNRGRGGITRGAVRRMEEVRGRRIDVREGLEEAGQRSGSEGPPALRALLDPAQKEFLNPPVTAQVVGSMTRLIRRLTGRQ